MRTLLLDGCHLGDCVAACVAAACPHLKRLSVLACGGLGREGIEAFACQCPLLEDISIGGYASGMWGGTAALSHFSGLQRLFLSRCLVLTDREFAECVQHMSRLSALRLSQCPCLSDAALAALPAATIETLCFSSCDDMTGAGCARFRRLRSLALAGCRGVTIAGVQSLAVACTRLARLRLPPHIPDDCLPLQGPGGHLHGLRITRQAEPDDWDAIDAM